AYACSRPGSRAHADARSCRADDLERDGQGRAVGRGEHAQEIGVGEQVDFTGSVAGGWKASAGTPSGPSATSFRWTAPATAAPVTIPLTPTAGAAVTDTITVVPPDEIAMRKVGSHTAQVGPGGACMLTEVTFKPLDVCLGAMQTLEVPEDGTSVSG